jgi:hypothetical protein
MIVHCSTELARKTYAATVQSSLPNKISCKTSHYQRRSAAGAAHAAITAHWLKAGWQ